MTSDRNVHNRSFISTEVTELKVKLRLAVDTGPTGEVDGIYSALESRHSLLMRH